MGRIAERSLPLDPSMSVPSSTPPRESGAQQGITSDSFDSRFCQSVADPKPPKLWVIESFTGWLLLTHNETSTAVQIDLAAMSRAIGDHPAYVVVDSVSGLGASEFKMDEWKLDIVCAASQKALACPPGLAMVAVSPRAWKKMKANKAPRFYFDLQKHKEFFDKGEPPWTPPVSVAFALDVAIDLYEREGARNVWARHARYTDALHQAIKALGMEIFSRDGVHSVTVTGIVTPHGL